MATPLDELLELLDLEKIEENIYRGQQPDEDRQQRLYGAFNGGYQAFSRLYRTCTPSAEEALTRLLVEAETTAREIHTRFAE